MIIVIAMTAHNGRVVMGESKICDCRDCCWFCFKAAAAAATLNIAKPSQWSFDCGCCRYCATTN